MKKPANLLRPKYTQEELIELLEKVQMLKARAIKNQQYEFAAQLRDDDRKYRAQLEDLMNPLTNTEIEHNKD